MFPICGGLKDDKYVHNGKEYTLKKHGFARHSKFEIIRSEKDYAAFLQLLDGVFSAYEKSDFHYEDAEYQRITEPVVARVSYPMAAGTDPANKTAIYYYILCPGMKEDAAKEEIMDHLCQLLNENSSPLKQNLQNASPSAGFSVGRELAGPDAAVWQGQNQSRSSQ